MTRRFVVGLDGSDYSKTATELACRRAQKYDAIVDGITVLDQTAIDELSRGAPAGAIHIAEEASATRTQKVMASIEQYHADFQATCKKHGVKGRVTQRVGYPSTEIMDEMKTADVVFLGLKTYFESGVQDEPCNTLTEILKNPVCPVMAVPTLFEVPKHVVIAYDGSIPASRAMRAFALVAKELPEDTVVHLLRVANDDDKNRSDLEHAADYLRLHGIEPQINIHPGDPGSVICNYAKSHSPCYVVMGAHSHNFLHEIFFGSTALKLLKDGSIAVFVYH